LGAIFCVVFSCRFCYNSANQENKAKRQRAAIVKKLSVYLDTSIINFLFADDAPEKREVTQEFFRDYVKTKVYDVYISPVVIDEMSKTEDEQHKIRLLNVVQEHHLEILNIEPRISAIETLAQYYLQNGVVPQRKLEDALHIAISTVYEMDVLLSWNYRHLANLNRERMVLSANIQQGYMKILRIVTPLEVMSDEK